MWLPMDREDVRKELQGRYVLISCEGAAEAVIAKTLIENNRLIVPREQLIEDEKTGERFTELRKPDDILNAFARYDYTLNGNDGMFALARIVDKAARTGRADKHYRGIALPFDFVTRPEIEMLMVIKEGKLRAWNAAREKRPTLKVSEFCKSELRIKSSKSRSYLERYWSDPDELVRCIREYHRIAEKKREPYLDLHDLIA